MQQVDLSAVAAIMAGNGLWQRYGVTIDAARHRLQSGLDAGASIAVDQSRPARSGVPMGVLVALVVLFGISVILNLVLALR